MNPMTMLIKTRTAMIALCESLTQEQLLIIPEGWSNNIYWHLGHCLVTQQTLVYKRTGSDLHVDPSIITACIKGSSPRTWDGLPLSFDDIKKQLIDLAEQCITDYQALAAKPYDSFVTGTGTPINTLDDAIDFNLYHEGMHMGLMIALTKYVSFS